MKIQFMTALLFVMVLGSCYAASDAKDLFPGDTMALDVFLKDQSTKEEISAGRVEAGWGYQRASLDSCKQTAKEEAKKRRIDDWDYYCCTVTKENACVTKIKAFQ